MLIRQLVRLRQYQKLLTTTTTTATRMSTTTAVAARTTITTTAAIRSNTSSSNINTTILGSSGGFSFSFGRSSLLRYNRCCFSTLRRGGGLLYRHPNLLNKTGRPPYLLKHPFGGTFSWIGCLGTTASSSVAYYSNQSSGRPPSTGGNKIARGVGLLGAASVLLGKSKYIFAALKVTKLASLGSMVLTVGTYSLFFGWPYAVGMVGLIFVHETGHAIVMHNRGIPFKPAVFIPFMGAVIATKQLPRDAWEDALIAAGGPALGSIGAGVVAIAAHQTNSQLLFALADFGFMINLFNLMPIGSMDGGRIAGAISPYAGVVGLGMGGFLAYQGVIYNPLFYLIMLAGGYETFMRFYNPHASTPPNYYKISSVQRGMITTGYFSLIACLLTAMAVNHNYQKPPEVLIRERELVEKSWDMR